MSAFKAVAGRQHSGAGPRPLRWRLPVLLCLLAALVCAAGWVLSDTEAGQSLVLRHASLEQLRRQAQRAPANPTAQYFLGHKLAERDRHQEAIECFSNGLRLLQAADNLKLRARIDGELARSLVAVGEHEAAIPYFKKALELDAGNVPAHMALGYVLLRRELWDVAAQEFRIVLMLEPRLAEAHFALGHALNESKHAAAAEGPLRTAVALAPRKALYRKELGESLAYQSRMEEAEATFRKAVELDPKDPSLQSALARIRALRARTPEEYREVRKALLPFAEGDARGNAFFLGHLGILDAQFGLTDDAERMLKRAVKLNPNHPEAYYNLALVYTRQGRPREAAEAMQRFQRIEGAHRRANALRKRLAAAPDHLGMNFELAMAWETEGKYPDAAAQYRRVLRLSPQHEPSLSRLRRLIRTHGDSLMEEAAGLP